MSRTHRGNDLSSSAQEYLLTLRIMAGESARITASQVARKLGVSTQAASEMFRRLSSDGLVSLAEGRELQLTKAGRSPSVARPRGPSSVSESSDSERARTVIDAPGVSARASR